MTGRSWRVTSKPWFGPKRMAGWGWRPVAWQGWVATSLLVILVAAAQSLLGSQPIKWVALAAILLAYIGLAAVTGDPPGGPSD